MKPGQIIAITCCGETIDLSKCQAVELIPLVNTREPLPENFQLVEEIHHGPRRRRKKGKFRRW